MNIVNAKVYLIASTQVCCDNINQYLRDIGSEKQYKIDGNYNGDLLTEIAGRVCYKSWEPGLNKNVTKIREDNKEYIENILKSGHGSTLEHFNVSLLFANVSRVFTHELVRHRAGMGYSQESLRYVRLDQINFFIPQEVQDDPKMFGIFTDAIKVFEHIQEDLNRIVDLDKMNFEQKKIWTSRFRRLTPLGLCTHILATGNLRAWRHIISMRSSKGAEEEIRDIQKQIREIMIGIAPNCFQDMNDQGEFLYQKV